LAGSLGVVTKPIVSVCVPTYNYARFLPDCIESILQQSISEWELIICDDCSTDGTHELLSQYAARDRRIRYIRNDCRLGMSPNLKNAADRAEAPYLKVLCADDWVTDRHLETMLSLMERHPHVVLGTCAEIHTDSEGRPLAVQFLMGQPLSVITGTKMLNRMARGHGFGGNSSFTIRTSAYRALGGYDPTIAYGVDYELAARLCRVGDYLHTDQPLFYGRSHGDSSSSVNPKKLLNIIDDYKIPNAIFQPRRFGNQEWRRYQRVISYVTARTILNVILEYARGHRSQARQLWQVARQHGNLALGLPYLALHAPWRICMYLRGRNGPVSKSPEAWMGRPRYVEPAI
jgi:glycosyltransferase involved in cell wall biosynthesis